jgi:hypothetical protein
MAAARPPVALVLEIDPGHYRDKLEDADCVAKCLALRTSLQSGVLAALEAKYPFLNWRGANPTDTIVVTIANGAGGGMLGSRLIFRFLGPTAQRDSDWLPVKFESVSDFRKREEEEWHPDSLRVAWLSVLPDKLTSDLVPRVLGRVPLPAKVTFTERRRVIVPAGKDEIQAQKPPIFEVGVRVVYAPDSLDADATVPLRKCDESGVTGYTCEVEELRFARSTRQAAALDSVLKFGTLHWKATRVTEFVARPRGARASGTGVQQPGTPP